MAKKTNSKNIIVTGKTEEAPFAVQFQGDYDKFPMVMKTIATNIYNNIYSPNISVPDAFDRQDYEYFRQGERIPLGITFDDVLLIP